MDRARASEARGREFESPQPHHSPAKPSAPSKHTEGAATRKIKGVWKSATPAISIRGVVYNYLILLSDWKVYAQKELGYAIAPTTGGRVTRFSCISFI